MSSRQKGKLRHALWNKFREIGGSDIEIERDPLHARYAVNRHGMRVVAETMELLEDVYDRVLALLTVEGWDIQVSPKNELFMVTQGAISAYVERPRLAAVSGGEFRIEVSFR